MNPVDVAIVALVAVLALLGLHRGLVAGILDLAGVVVAVALVARYAPHLTGPLSDLGLERWAAAATAFAVLSALAIIIAGVVTGLLALALLRRFWPHPVRFADGLLGVLPGAARGVAIAAVLLVPLAFLQRPSVMQHDIHGSRLARPLLDAGLDALYDASGRFDQNVADFAAITAPPVPGTVRLPFTVTAGLAPDAAAEQALFDQINNERTGIGLTPLRLDPALTAVARNQGEEMFRLGYVSQVSPLQGNLGRRLDAAGVQYRAEGENLAIAPSLAAAGAEFLRDPESRAHILDPGFTRIGVGVIRSQHRGLAVAEEFTR